ncbi:MAG: ImmA/IrrE family metallo-endopeptidase [Clostridia bacterium]|nr:ImmA/IrrE family metallo-endopeptidase [Clostridia bacterium]
MKIEYLKTMDTAVRKVGSRDPDDILAYFKFIYIDPGSHLPGFITKRKGTVYYGVNKSLSKQKYAFGSFHEAFHGICGHLNDPDFLEDGGHMDSFADRYHIAKAERDANIGAADTLIDTSLFLELTGSDSREVQSYLKSVESFEQAVSDYRRHYEIAVSNRSPESRIKRMVAYKDELAAMYEELMEQAADISNSGICLSKSEIAQEFDVPVYIIDYKYEAMAVRNYDVPSVELPKFEKVFSGW